MSAQPPPQWRLHEATKLRYFIFKKDGKLGYKFEDGRVLTQREFDQLTNHQDPRSLPRTIPPAGDAYRPPISRTKSGQSDDDRDANQAVVSQSLVGSPPDRHYAHAPQNSASHGQGTAYAGRQSGTAIYPASRNNGRRLEPRSGPVEHVARDDSQSAEDTSPPRLNQLGRGIMDIPPGSYGKLYSFVVDHPEILDHHEIDGLFAEARSQERYGNQRDAQRLIHHGLLLRKCRDLGAGDYAMFFKQLDDRSSNTFAAFTKGMRDLYATIQEHARTSMQQPRNPNSQNQDQRRPLAVHPAAPVGRRDSYQPLQQPQVPATPELSRQAQRVQTKDGRWVYLDKDGQFLQIASSRSDADRHKGDTDRHKGDTDRHKGDTDRHKGDTDRHKGDTDVKAVTNRINRLDVESKPRGAQVRDPGVRHSENSPYGAQNVENLPQGEQSDRLMPLQSEVRSAREIRGTDGETEKLDPRYKKRKDAEKFFVRGRVFSLLWHEPAGNNMRSNLSGPIRITRGKFGEEIFSHILRMVVVKEMHGACLCLPVNTYGRKGVSKSGFSKADREAHAIIYMSDTKPRKLAEETDMTKKPIAVDKSSADQKLDETSRLNFSRVHTVNWNVKVMDVGTVARTSMPSLVTYYTSSVV